MKKCTKIAGLEVVCILALRAITALVSSGLPSSKFIFEGFFKKKIERDKHFWEIRNSKTTIIYESPHRPKRLLQELKNYCWF